MNKLIVSLIGAGLTFLLAMVAQAVDAQWNLNPISGNWNISENWTPPITPHLPGDTATFALSNTTNVFLSVQVTEVDSITFTPAATNPYTITANLNTSLTLSGTGITNNSGTTESFVTVGSAGGVLFHSHIDFTNSATAGSSTLFTNNGSAVDGRAGGSTIFHDTSTAANGTFTNNGATVSGGFGGATLFSGDSHADSATLIATGGTNGGQGGTILFEDDSDGGTSRVVVSGNGNLDMTNHNLGQVTIGSIEGNGDVFLGRDRFLEFIVGGNNMDTTFSGNIQGDAEAELTKVGTGTLTLSGGNTYRGDTFIDRGVLKVNGSIRSETTVDGGTLAGTGTVRNDVSNEGRSTVSPGDPLGMLTVTGDYTQLAFATLMIKIAGVSDDQFSVLDVFRNAELDGILKPVLLNGFIPSVGQTFVFLYSNGLDGEFSRIANQTFNNGMEHWEVTYEDTNAILTAQAGAAAPDQASTLFLLTLSLLGLVTYHRQLRRKQG